MIQLISFEFFECWNLRDIPE